MLTAAFPIAEPIVGAECFSVAASPTGDDVPLAREQFWPGGQQPQRRVIELVNRSRFFQFHGDSWKLVSVAESLLSPFAPRK